MNSRDNWQTCIRKEHRYPAKSGVKHGGDGVTTGTRAAADGTAGWCLSDDLADEWSWSRQDLHFQI